MQESIEVSVCALELNASGVLPWHSTSTEMLAPCAINLHSIIDECQVRFPELTHRQWLTESRACPYQKFRKVVWDDRL